MWEANYIETSRGRFEYFVAGNGKPLAITHFYMEFNSKGNLFANPFNKEYKQLGLNDLEAIREALGLDGWAFAGRSTRMNTRATIHRRSTPIVN